MLPRLFVDSLPGYRLVYGIAAAGTLLLACLVGVVLSRALGARAPPWPWRRLAFTVLALGPIVVARFDALPALLVGCSLLCLSRDRAFVGGLCAGAAVLAKLYPLLLLIPWALVLWAEGRRRQAALLLGGATVAMAVIAAPFLSAAPGPFVSSLFVYGGRPFQIESLVGALAVLIGGKSAIVASFGSYNVHAPPWLGTLFGVLLPTAVVLMAFTAARQARVMPATRAEDGHARLFLWTVAVLAIVLLTSKVLSPQYLIWLVPLAAITPGALVYRWSVAAAVITQVFYPPLYDSFAEGGSRWVALIVVLRNAALVAVAVTAVRAATASERDPSREEARESAPRPPPSHHPA